MIIKITTTYNKAHLITHRKPMGFAELAAFIHRLEGPDGFKWVDKIEIIKF